MNIFTARVEEVSTKDLSYRIAPYRNLQYTKEQLSNVRSSGTTVSASRESFGGSIHTVGSAVLVCETEGQLTIIGGVPRLTVTPRSSDNQFQRGTYQIGVEQADDPTSLTSVGVPTKYWGDLEPGDHIFRKGDFVSKVCSKGTYVGSTLAYDAHLKGGKKISTCKDREARYITGMEVDTSVVVPELLGPWMDAKAITNGEVPPPPTGTVYTRSFTSAAVPEAGLATFYTQRGLITTPAQIYTSDMFGGILGSVMGVIAELAGTGNGLAAPYTIARDFVARPKLGKYTAVPGIPLPAVNASKPSETLHYEYAVLNDGSWRLGGGSVTDTAMAIPFKSPALTYQWLYESSFFAKTGTYNWRLGPEAAPGAGHSILATAAGSLTYLNSALSIQTLPGSLVISCGAVTLTVTPAGLDISGPFTINKTPYASHTHGNGNNGSPTAPPIS